MVAWIRRLLRVEKTGHSGTLDPKVTGKRQGRSGREASCPSFCVNVQWVEQRGAQVLAGSITQLAPPNGGLSTHKAVRFSS